MAVSACLIFTGAGLMPKAHGQLDLVGQWSPVVNWPVVNINVCLLPNGKFLLWPRDGGNQARIWDPATNGFTLVPLPTTNLFCAGHSFLADGTLVVPGGHIADGEGEKEAHLFDYRNNTWTRVADMNAGRWYPTSTTLANGEALVSSGSTINYTANQVFQVFQPSTRTWRILRRTGEYLTRGRTLPPLI
jgi:galactose oxidase